MVLLFDNNRNGLRQMTNFKLLAASAGMLLIVAGGVAAQDLASGEEIQKLLSGNTLVTTNGEDIFHEYYDPDGTIRAEGYTAKWEVQGNMGCMDYGEGMNCWTAVIDGNANIWYRDGKEIATGAGMAVMGNAKGY